MLRLKTHDCTGGFRCYRREMLQQVPWDEMQLKGYAFQVGSLFHVEQLGGKVAEIPIIFEDRRVGKSKMSYQIVFEAFIYVIQVALFGRAGTNKQSIPVALTTKEKPLL
jgi:dolichol-phosphate mannosyltransferase